MTTTRLLLIPISALALSASSLFPVPSAANESATAETWTASDAGLWGKPERIGAPGIVKLPSGNDCTYFNGNYQALVFPLNPIEGLGAFTIEVLFRPDADGAEEQRFFHAEDEQERRVLLETRLDPNSGRWSLDTHLWADPSTRQTLLDRSKTHSPDAWHWVALTYDGQTMRHYVNGVFELEGDIRFPPPSKGRVSLGMRLNKISPFKGSIREVRISPRALPPAELQSKLP